MDSMKRVPDQSDTEMKNKSDSELNSAPTGDTTPFVDTAKSATDGDGGNDNKATDIPSPLSQSPPQPQPQRSEVEIENIKDQSPFYVFKFWSAPGFRVPPGPTPTPIEGYNETVIDSPYFDRTTGIYTVPLKGKCWFLVGDEGVEGAGNVDWFLCRGDGRRKRMTGRKWKGGWYLYNEVDWECEEGERVWAEVVRVGGDVIVERFAFNGGIKD